MRDMKYRMNMMDKEFKIIYSIKGSINELCAESNVSKEHIKMAIKYKIYYVSYFDSYIEVYRVS